MLFVKKNEYNKKIMPQSIRDIVNSELFNVYKIIFNLVAMSLIRLLSVINIAV